MEPDFAAAVSLSSLSGLTVPQSVGQWPQQIHNLPPARLLSLNGDYISVEEQQNGGIAPMYPAPPFNATDVLDEGKADSARDRDGWKLNNRAGRDISGFDHFREFANFLEGVGLPAEWSPYFNGPDRPHDQLPGGHQSRAASATPDPTSHGARLGTPFSCWLPSAPATNGNRITSYAHDHSK